MTIVNELKRIEKNIKASYTALKDKGAELPTVQNSDNLASAIANLEVGGGGDEWVQILFETGAPQKLVIPNNIKKVRDYAFAYMSTYPSWAKNIEEIEGEEVEELGASVFAGQSNVEKLNLPKLKIIGDDALKFSSNSSNVKYIKFGALEYIGDNAFSYVFQNGSIDFCEYSLAQGCEIGKSAFSYCGLPSFDFTGVKSIGASCFNYATVKMKIWVPSTVETINCTSTGTSMFANSQRQHLIFTDVADENSVPSGWGAQWNKASGTLQKVTYNATYQDFLNA